MIKIYMASSMSVYSSIETWSYLDEIKLVNTINRESASIQFIWVVFIYSKPRIYYEIQPHPHIHTYHIQFLLNTVFIWRSPIIIL